MVNGSPEKVWECLKPVPNGMRVKWDNNVKKFELLERVTEVRFTALCTLSTVTSVSPFFFFLKSAPSIFWFFDYIACLLFHQGRFFIPEVVAVQYSPSVSAHTHAQCRLKEIDQHLICVVFLSTPHKTLLSMRTHSGKSQKTSEHTPPDVCLCVLSLPAPVSCAQVSVCAVCVSARTSLCIAPSLPRRLWGS